LEVARSLNSLACLYRAQGKWAEAEPLYKRALEMRRRLFKGDHPEVAQSLNNLACLYHAQGRLADAEPVYKGAFEMRSSLFQADHPEVAQSLNNLACLYVAQGKLAEAESVLKDALEMDKRLITTFAKQQSEGAALTLASSYPLTRDAYLSVARAADLAGTSD